ncbi:MAG: HNH endonuclease [Anaerolineae bacterium]|nr:HNH endonuclease [Anaerolineae bacterium]
MTMHIDHIVPLSAGGLTAEANLCLACALCNRSKHQHQEGIDPETGSEAPLFHPRRQVWKDHFAWDVDWVMIEPRSLTGRVTIARLKLNDTPYRLARPFWKQGGWHPPGA